MTTEETEDEANFRRTSWLVRHMTGNTSRVPVSVVWRNEPILQLDVEVASTVRQLKTLIASATFLIVLVLWVLVLWHIGFTKVAFDVLHHNFRHIDLSLG